MATILESFTGMLSGDTVGQIGKAIGVSPDLITKGMSVAGPLITMGIAKMTSTQKGMSSFSNALDKTQSIPATGSGDMMSGIMSSMDQSGGTSADMMQGLLGNGVNAIGGTLSQKLGFNIRPILAMAAPMVMGVLGKTMKSEHLDAAGVAQKLQTENKAWQADPANKETAGLIQDAMSAGQKGEALRNKFTDAEWEKVRMGPVAATYLVGVSSPSQGASALKELGAASTSVEDTLKTVSPTSVIGTAFGSGFTEAELEGLQQARPTTESVLRTINEAQTIVASKSPNDAKDYAAMVMTVATNVANAAKEGGFLGIGGEQVSNEEQVALSQIKRALSA
jgi:hypothetical protein